MARDKAREEQQDEEPSGEAPKKKKGKLLLILAILSVLAGGGGAAWYFLQPGSPEAKEEKPKPPVFVTLETFTVNLQSDGGERYLQVGIDLKVTDQAVADAIKVHMPEIRNGVLLLLSSKRSEELASVEGKQKLSAEIQEQVNKPLRLRVGSKGVIGVYFTSFVIQ
jgi:flagellar FliL protein